MIYSTQKVFILTFHFSSRNFVQLCEYWNRSRAILSRMVASASSVSMGTFWKWPSSVLCVVTTCVGRGLTAAPHNSLDRIRRCCGTFCHSSTIAWTRSCTVCGRYRSRFNSSQTWQANCPGQGKVFDVSDLEFILHDSGNTRTSRSVLQQHNPWSAVLEKKPGAVGFITIPFRYCKPVTAPSMTTRSARWLALMPPQTIIPPPPWRTRSWMQLLAWRCPCRYRLNGHASDHQGPYCYRANSPLNWVYPLKGDDTENIGMCKAQIGLSAGLNGFK